MEAGSLQGRGTGAFLFPQQGNQGVKSLCPLQAGPESGILLFLLAMAGCRVRAGAGPLGRVIGGFPCQGMG